MRIEKTYIADDGTKFDNERACVEYEQALNTEELSKYILCFDYMGRRITDYNWGRIKYCKVMPGLENMPSNIVDTWLNVVDNELDNCICECDHEDGWYFLDEYDRWQYWADFETEFNKIKAEIHKLKIMNGD